MKKTLFFLSLLCLIGIPIKGFGQDADGGRFLSFGAKAGGNFSQFSQPGTILTGNVGGFVRLQPLSFLQIQGEILYDVMGGGRRDLQRDLTLFGDGFSEIFVLNGPISSLEYINRHVYFHTAKIPVSVRIGVPELADAPIQPKFIIGGSYAYILKTTEVRDSYFQFENRTRLILSDTKENVKGDYTSSNIAIHGGIELDFYLENDQTFSMGFIYNQGISDLNDIKIGQPENIENLRSRSISFNLSYTIF